MDADRDHPRTRSGEPRPVDPDDGERPCRCPGRGRRLAADAPHPARAARRAAGSAPAAGVTGRARRNPGFPALARRRQLHLSRLSRIRFRRRRRAGATRAGDPARPRLSDLRRVARPLLAAARRAGFSAPPRTARRHQIEPARHRSPHRAYGRDRPAPVWRRRRGRRHPAVSRAVHLARLQPQPALDPAVTAQGAPYRRPRRAVADRP